MGRFWAAFLATLATLLIAIDVTTLGARWLRVADGFTGYRPQFLVCGTILLTLLLFVKRRGLVRSAAWGLVLVVVHQVYWCLPFLKENNSPDEVVREGELTCHVVAFNLLHSNQDSDRAIRYFREEDPDVLILFESIKHWPAALAALKDSWPHHLRIADLEMEMFSKHPIASNQIYRFGDYRGFVVCDLLVDETPLTVVMNHCYAPINFGERGYRWRNEQIQMLGEALATHRDPLVVIGDFNASPWSPVMRDLLAQTQWQRSQGIRGLVGTHALIAPQTPLLAHAIDHALVNDQARLVQTTIGPYLGSDHRPIHVEFALPCRSGSSEG